MRNFLINSEESGREIVTFPETGKKYYVEYIGENHVKWGDINPATKTVSEVKSKYKGSISPEESLITKENGFENIKEGKGSPYAEIEKRHTEYLKTL